MRFAITRFHPTTRLAVGNLGTSGLLLPRSQMLTHNPKSRFHQTIHNQLHTIREVDTGSFISWERIVRRCLGFSHGVENHVLLLHIHTYLTISTSGGLLLPCAGVIPIVCWMHSNWYTRTTKIYRKNITLTIDWSPASFDPQYWLIKWISFLGAGQETLKHEL